MNAVQTAIVALDYAVADLRQYAAEVIMDTPRAKAACAAIHGTLAVRAQLTGMIAEEIKRRGL